MKVFFDTNVYIAEALLGGAAAQMVDATEGASWRIFVSAYVLDECERVMTDRLGFSLRLGVLTRRRIARRATVVEARETRHVVPGDPSDNPILRAALAAGADLLVTNDAHLLTLHPYEGLRIVSMSDYHRLLAEAGLLR